MNSLNARHVREWHMMMFSMYNALQVIIGGSLIQIENSVAKLNLTVLNQQVSTQYVYLLTITWYNATSNWKLTEMQMKKIGVAFLCHVQAMFEWSSWMKVTINHLYACHVTSDHMSDDHVAVMSVRNSHSEKNENINLTEAIADLSYAAAGNLFYKTSSIVFLCMSPQSNTSIACYNVFIRYRCSGVG